MKHESVGKIIKEFCALRAKAYIYVTNKKDENKHKKVSNKKKIIIR